MASISVTSTSTSSISCRIIGLDTSYSYSGRTVDWYLDGSYYSSRTLGAGVSSGASVTFSGLDEGTRYSIRAVISNIRGSSDVTLYGSASTSVFTGSFSISSYDSKSVRVRISYPSSASYSRVFITDTSGNNVGSGDSVSGFITSTSFTYSNLKPLTTYYINVAFYTSASSSSEYSRCTRQSFTTPKPEIEYWSWTYSNGTATDAQTSTAYAAVIGKGKLSDFSYKVWNDMVEKVSEVLVAKGYSNWNDYYTTKANTLMSSTDKDLTALRFNSLRYNIGAHYSTGVGEVHRNDIVYGSYFVDLMEALNNWIG